MPGGAGGGLDTLIPGNPGDIAAVSEWLRTGFGDGCSTLATTVYAQRSQAASEWQGLAAAAFHSRVTTLAQAADTVSSRAGAMAGRLDTLAGALRRAHHTMTDVRSTAAAAGLTVEGTVIRHPGAPPPDAGPEPGADADRSTVEAWHRANDAVEHYNERARAWNTAVEHAGDARADWESAIEEADQLAEDRRAFVHVSGDFLEETAKGGLELKQGSILKGQAGFYEDLAEQTLADRDALVDDEGTVVDPDRYYELDDAARDYATRADTVLEESRVPELPKGLGSGLTVIGAAATVYVTYDEIKHGEDPTEAVVANGVGFGAAVLAGTEVGGTVGTMIGGPVGTVVGAGVGAVTGVVVGAFTTGAITSLWDHAGEGLGAVGGALEDGVSTVGNTFESAGSAIEDGIGSAWHGIFG